jgi:hypothetical protein
MQFYDQAPETIWYSNELPMLEIRKKNHYCIILFLELDHKKKPSKPLPIWYSQTIFCKKKNSLWINELPMQAPEIPMGVLPMLM